jgi:eukaryotic-like serine/threonine-protein kinase
VTLDTGTKIGSYEITAEIGRGGMGEVYRARDPKLGRDVAIKVLPDSFARDAERMARFEREAKVLASLNRPNKWWRRRRGWWELAAGCAEKPNRLNRKSQDK